MGSTKRRMAPTSMKRCLAMTQLMSLRLTVVHVKTALVMAGNTRATTARSAGAAGRGSVRETAAAAADPATPAGDLANASAPVITDAAPVPATVAGAPVPATGAVIVAAPPLATATVDVGALVPQTADAAVAAAAPAAPGGGTDPAAASTVESSTQWRSPLPIRPALSIP